MTDEELKILSVLKLQMHLLSTEQSVLDTMELLKVKNKLKQDCNALLNTLRNLHRIFSNSPTLTNAETKKLKQNTFGTGSALYTVLDFIALIHESKVDAFVDEVGEVAKKYLQNA